MGRSEQSKHCYRLENLAVVVAVCSAFQEVGISAGPERDAVCLDDHGWQSTLPVQEVGQEGLLSWSRAFTGLPWFLTASKTACGFAFYTKSPLNSYL